MTCVITFKNITKSTWNDRFSGKYICCISSKSIKLKVFWENFPYFLDVYSLCVAHPEPFADKLYMVTFSQLIKIEEKQKNIHAFYTLQKGKHRIQVTVSSKLVTFFLQVNDRLFAFRCNFYKILICFVSFKISFERCFRLCRKRTNLLEITLGSF